MKKDDRVWKYEIRIDYSKNEVKKTSECYTVLGVNDVFLVIDDLFFTSIKRQPLYQGDNDSLYNEVWIWESQILQDNILRGVLYTNYTDDKQTYDRMKKVMQKFINTKYEKYGKAISILMEV